MEIFAWCVVGLIVFAAVLQIRNLFGIVMFLLMKHFGICKRWFIPMRSTKAMSNMLETIINTIEVNNVNETDSPVRVNLRRNLLVVEQESCETVYILVDPRSAFYGCCVNSDCNKLIFQEMPNVKTVKKLKKLVDSMFGEFNNNPNKLVTPKRF